MHNTVRDNDLGIFISWSGRKSIRYFIDNSNGYHVELKVNEIDSADKLNVYTNLLDCFSYWMGQYFSKVELSDNVNVIIKLTDDIVKYSSLEEGKEIEYKKCSFSIDDNILTMSISALTYLSFGSTLENVYEKESVVDVIEYITTECDLEIIEEIFFPKQKKENYRKRNEHKY